MKEPERKKLKKITRILSAVSGVLLLIIVFVPLWKIELTAPQYPEGLEMFIHTNKVSGQVDIINGLNHYIGMREIHEDDFAEFAILPYVFAAFALFGVLTALVNRKWFFYVWAGSFIIFSILAFVDFYFWLYNYGHNLNPAAPIKVPGMTYQPPLLGFKQLLNFGAYSIPALGGWLMGTVALFIAAMGFIELRSNKIKIG